MVEAGIIIINKEKDYTSHDVAAVVKKTLRIKTGHTGTLDPQAQGVLPICLGRATKLAGLLTADTKTYVASVHLGITTDTYDITGQILSKSDIILDERKIKEAVMGFMGEQMQQPPMYSAIKVNGKKLYQLARAGQTVEREARKIIIDELEILNFNPESKIISIKVSCSKGTYIRSLCNDLGMALGCGACMGDLVRTRSGIFFIEDSITLGLLKENENREEYIWPVERALPYPAAYACNEAEKLAYNGNPIPVKMASFTQASSDRFWLYLGERLIGLYKPEQRWLKPEVMLV